MQWNIKSIIPLKTLTRFFYKETEKALKKKVVPTNATPKEETKRNSIFFVNGKVAQRGLSNKSNKLFYTFKTLFPLRIIHKSL